LIGNKMRMDRSINRREFTRVHIAVGVEVDLPGHTKISGRGRDLSVKGVYVQCPRQLPRNTRCDVTIVLSGAPEPMQVHVTGTVVYAEPGGMGIEFVEVDVDSFIHLRNLVLYNSVDTEQVEREFDQHLGLKRRG
jgi:hypothetical protein